MPLNTPSPALNGAPKANEPRPAPAAAFAPMKSTA
jgi:hypothetical protein